MDSGDESDHDPISTEMLEDILDGSQSSPNVIISPVCSLKDVAQGVYITDGRIAIAYE